MSHGTRWQRLWLPIKGRVLGFWWGVVRSEDAQRRWIVRCEMGWCGKGLNPQEMDELIVEQRPKWRRR